MKFDFSGNQIKSHMLILGVSGRGASSVMEEAAKRLGISVDELAARMDADAERQSEHKSRADRKEAAEKARNLAVREAYWNATTEEIDDLYILSDSFSEFINSQDAPTREQLKVLFLDLPEHLIGKGISWGFDDTEVRDDIYVHIRENRATLRLKLGL